MTEDTSMESEDSSPRTYGDIGTVAALADETRRKVYDHVVSATTTRDQTAEAMGMSRATAAYHLDRLAEAGLVDVEFKRLSGKTGPGAGRPSKLYTRSQGMFDASIPARRYELAATILLETVRTAGVETEKMADVARQVGSQIGVGGLDSALAATGYEPMVEDGETRFRNCPFPVLRDQDLEVTCNLNLALVSGMIEGSGSDATAALDPEEGYCCVRLKKA